MLASDVLTEWILVEGDFHAAFGVDLSELLHVKTWRWFWTRVRYLLRSPDTALCRHFTPPAEPPAEETPTFEL